MNFEEFKAKHQKVEVKEFPNYVLESIQEPALSVLVITYQHVNFIRDTLEGILQQKTNFPFEIVIGDDASTDGTREICIEYAQRNPDKIRLFLHERANNIAILNKPCLIFQYIYNCFNLRGKYVAGVSGDDYWTDPTKLQKQYDFLIKNPDYSMCYHKWVIVNGDVKNTINVNKSKTIDRVVTGKSPRGLSLMYKNIYHNVPFQLAEVLAEDTFAKFILSTLGKKKYISNINPAIYREHQGGIWSLAPRLFKYDSDVLSATKILETYFNTKYRSKLEALLLARLLIRKLYLIENKTKTKTIFNTISGIFNEMQKHKFKFYFPFRLEVSGYKISVQCLLWVILIKMNEVKWKLKYNFVN
jgi:glycosyltransferase involved in cell wall biosynthesis